MLLNRRRPEAAVVGNLIDNDCATSRHETGLSPLILLLDLALQCLQQVVVTVLTGWVSRLSRRLRICLTVERVLVADYFAAHPGRLILLVNRLDNAALGLYVGR